jgi:hypothetical protein
MEENETPKESLHLETQDLVEDVDGDALGVTRVVHGDPVYIPKAWREELGLGHDD